MRDCHGKRCSGAFLERSLPEFQRQFWKKLFTRLLGGLRTLVEDTHDLQHERGPVNSARPVTRRHSCESLFPALDSREWGIGPEKARPVQWHNCNWRPAVQ